MLKMTLKLDDRTNVLKMLVVNPSVPPSAISFCTTFDT